MPLWSPDGSELYYRSPEGIMAVGVETDPGFKLGTPKMLFADRNYDEDWDIHPDGKRFLMMKYSVMADEQSTEGSVAKINVVLNWLEELKERVPAQ